MNVREASLKYMHILACALMSWVTMWVVDGLVMRISCAAQFVPDAMTKTIICCACWHIVVLSYARWPLSSSHLVAFVERLGHVPRDYKPSKIEETWFLWLPIEEISWVRLCLLRGRCRWGLLYWAGISGVFWVDELRKTWVAWVRESGQQQMRLENVV